MVKAFIWRRKSGDINVKTLNDLLSVLETVASDDELHANLDIKHFLIKWLEENFPRKGDLTILLKDASISDVHKLCEALIERLHYYREKQEK